MRRTSTGAFAAVAVAALYVVRAGIGVPADRAYHRGAAAAAEGRYGEAVDALARGAVGADRDDALWLEGQVRLGLWDALAPNERAGGPGAAMLGRASSAFLVEYASSPASGWPVSGLGQVYARRERASRASRTIDLDLLDQDPWFVLGDDGRVAAGLFRLAIDREPNTVAFRDRLVLLLAANGLHKAARDAVRETARVLPDFEAHAELSFDALPRDLVETFYDASRREIGLAPLQLRERHLLSLGKLARRLGRLQDSEADLRGALGAPATTLFHAEDAYHLAMTLIDQARYDDALSQLAHAWEAPVFRPAVLSARATISEREGRLEDALESLAEQRRLEPRDVGLCLRFADIASRLGAFDRAEESLHWALVLAPDDLRPRRALVALYLRKGDGPAALRAFQDLETHGATTPEDEALRRAVEPLGS